MSAVYWNFKALPDRVHRVGFDGRTIPVETFKEIVMRCRRLYDCDLEVYDKESGEIYTPLSLIYKNTHLVVKRVPLTYSCPTSLC